VISTAALLGCALVSGCATQGKRPTEELTKARTVVEQADKGNAQRYAAADLQRAHDEMTSADNAANNKKYDDARRLAENAEVDADLAMARANSGEAQRALQDIQQGIETLKHEANRPRNDAGPGPMGPGSPDTSPANPGQGPGATGTDSGTSTETPNGPGPR
jgi:pyruvate kinase